MYVIIGSHSLKIMESFDNRFTSQVDFNYCKDNIECNSASNAPMLNFRQTTVCSSFKNLLNQLTRTQKSSCQYKSSF